MKRRYHSNNERLYKELRKKYYELLHIVQNCIKSLESFQEDNSKIDNINYVLEKLKLLINNLE